MIKVKTLEFSDWQEQFGERFKFADTHPELNPLGVRYIIEQCDDGEQRSDSLLFKSKVINDDGDELEEIGLDSCWEEAEVRCQTHLEQHVSSLIEPEVRDEAKDIAEELITVTGMRIESHYHRVSPDGDYSKAYDNMEDIVLTKGCLIVKHTTIEEAPPVVTMSREDIQDGTK